MHSNKCILLLTLILGYLYFMLENISVFFEAVKWSIQLHLGCSLVNSQTSHELNLNIINYNH